MESTRGIIAAGVRNPVLANGLTICALVGAWYALRHTPREVYPEYSINNVSVEVVYPGASSEDVEQAICIAIEEALLGMEGTRELTAHATENVGTVFFALTGARDTADVVNETKDRVGRITTFPPEAEKPVVFEWVLKTQVINIAVAVDESVPERTLKEYALEVRDDLLALPEISQVSLSGVRDDEIIVELSEETLKAYDLTFQQVMSAISRGSLDLPAGTIQTGDEEVTLRVRGRRLSAAQYEDLVVIDHPEALVRLGDVATVREGFADVTSVGRFNGQPAVLITVFKTPAEDTTRIAQRVRDYVSHRQAELPTRVTMSVWGDESQDVTKRINMLLRNGASGFLLVIITLWLFLRLRIALWVAMGIPVAFGGALIYMHLAGETINLISLFALIMVSGMIVDDAIVIAEHIHSRWKAGDGPEQASINGATRMVLPVLGSSLTTIIAFLPLLYVAGVMGKFIHVLPVVVIAAIVSSGVEAFLVLPAHLCRRVPVGRRPPPPKTYRLRAWLDRAIDEFIARRYRPLYHLALRYRGVVAALGASVAVVVAGLFLSGRMAFVLLPKEDGDMLRAQVRFPEGTPLTTTRSAVARLEAAAEALNDDPTLRPDSPGKLVQRVYSVTGEFADFVPVRGNNLCDVRLELMPAELRRIDQEEVIRCWRERIGELHDAVTFTIRRDQVAPTDRPIEIRLLGDDLEQTAEAAEQVRQALARYEGITESYIDLIPGKRELEIGLKPGARALGLSLEDVARQLRQGFLGGEAVRVRRGRNEVVVRVRYPEQERLSIADLEQAYFRTIRGESIPFHEAVEVRWARGYAAIQHEDTKRRVRVLADVDERVANAERILRDLETTTLPRVTRDFEGVRYSFGGNRSLARESLSSLYSGFLLALLVNFALLAGMLRSYVQPLVILFTVPLGVVGAVVGHAVMGYDLTLMSVFGIVALSGVVVNDALVLLDAVNGSIRAGASVREAVYAAGEQRFRAVILTSVTTIAGLAPLLAERSSQARAIIPMATSLVFGIAFATFLTLFVIPATYLIVNDVRRFARWLLLGGKYPEPEAVEEAARERAWSPG